MSNLLYHYTDVRGFHKIIKNHCIWLSNVFYLNDYAEHVLFCEKIRQEVKARLKPDALTETERVTLEELKTIVDADSIFDYYCAAFSTDGNHLGQWCRYADDGKGFAIGFDRGQLPPNRGVRKIMPTILRVRPVRYAPDIHGKRAKGFVDRRLRNAPKVVGSKRHRAELQRLVGYDSLQYKDEHFKDENEERILFLPGEGGLPRNVKGPNFRPSGSRIVPYYEFQLPAGAVKEVVLGPQNDCALNKHSVRQFLHANECDPNEVALTPSQITYRSA